MTGWCRDGLTDEQIARNAGITASTLYEWKKKYPEISEALKKGKEVADREVENALHERALGGIREVKKVFKLKEKYYDDHGRLCEKEKLQSAIDQIYIPGDTTAQIFWLKNRKPEAWREKRVVENQEEYEDDGFLDALNGQAKKVFEKAGDVIET